MFSETKYVVGDIENSIGVPFTVAVLFPGHIKHKVMGRVFIEGSIRSGGFVFLESDTGRVRCYGESVSLKVKALPEEDEPLISKLLKQEF